MIWDLIKKQIIQNILKTEFFMFSQAGIKNKTQNLEK